jgi:hypothetical protein
MDLENIISFMNSPIVKKTALVIASAGLALSLSCGKDASKPDNPDEWEVLTPQTIRTISADTVIAYANIDDCFGNPVENVQVVGNYSHFRPFYSKPDIKITDIEKSWRGQDTVRVTGDDHKATFILRIAEDFLNKIYQRNNLDHIDRVYQDENRLVIYDNRYIQDGEEYIYTIREIILDPNTFNFISESYIGSNEWLSLADNENSVFLSNGKKLYKKDKATYRTTIETEFPSIIRSIAANSNHVYLAIGDSVQVISANDLLRERSFFCGRSRIITPNSITANESEIAILRTDDNSQGGLVNLEIYSTNDFSMVFHDGIPGGPFDGRLNASDAFLLLNSENTLKIYDRNTHEILWTNEQAPYFSPGFGVNANTTFASLVTGDDSEITHRIINVRTKELMYENTTNDIFAFPKFSSILTEDRFYLAGTDKLIIYSINP